MSSEADHQQQQPQQQQQRLHHQQPLQIQSVQRQLRRESQDQRTNDAIAGVQKTSPSGLSRRRPHHTRLGPGQLDSLRLQRRQEDRVRKASGNYATNLFCPN